MTGIELKLFMLWLNSRRQDELEKIIGERPNSDVLKRLIEYVSLPQLDRLIAAFQDYERTKHDHK